MINILFILFLKLCPLRKSADVSLKKQQTVLNKSICAYGVKMKERAYTQEREKIILPGGVSPSESPTKPLRQTQHLVLSEQSALLV